MGFAIVMIQTFLFPGSPGISPIGPAPAPTMSPVPPPPGSFPAGSEPPTEPAWFQAWNPMYWWEARARAIRALEENPITGFLSPHGGTEFTYLRLQDRAVFCQTATAVLTSLIGVPAVTRVLTKLRLAGMALPFFFVQGGTGAGPDI